MRRLTARATLVVALAVTVAACGQSTQSDSGDECLDLFVQAMSDLQREYEAGELDGTAEGEFLDEHGVNAVGVPAEHRVRQVDGCEWLGTQP